MRQRVLLKDIANRLKMSITTISFVINGKAKENNISDATIKKVLDVVEELGYQPNSLATSLRTGKTKILGFLVDDISEPFFASIARFIDEKATEKGYKILFSSTRNSNQKALELLQIFQDRHVDGYILALPEGLETEIEKLIETNIPVVLFDRYVPGLISDYVVIDNQESTYNATQHLINNGYKDIALVTIDTEQQQMLDRQKGYNLALIEGNLNSNIIYISYGDEIDVVDQIASKLFAEKKYDAVIFAANYICLDGLRAMRKLGIKIYEDIAVLSFDDFELLEFCNPPVTAIAQPIESIAENIMKIMMSKLNPVNTRVVNKQVMLPTELNIRSSTLKRA